MFLGKLQVPSILKNPRVSESSIYDLYRADSFPVLLLIEYSPSKYFASCMLLRSVFSDLHYYPANYLRSMFWIGLSGSYVRLDPTLKKWVLIQTATSTTAISDATEASLLMGMSRNQRTKVQVSFLAQNKEKKL